MPFHVTAMVSSKYVNYALSIIHGTHLQLVDHTKHPNRLEIMGCYGNGYMTIKHSWISISRVRCLPCSWR